MRFTILLFVMASCLCSSYGQQPTFLRCDSAACDMSYLNGLRLETMANDVARVSVSTSYSGSYLLANVTILNVGSAPFDVLPETFSAAEMKNGKEKTLPFMSVSKMERRAERRVAWANGLNAFGAAMATQQVTTQTTSSGDVNLYSSDGTSASGSYNGSSTSTTYVPNYQARATAQQNIAYRRTELRNSETELESTAIRDNTLVPNGTIAGTAYFKRGPKTGDIVIRVPLGNSVFEFPFSFSK
jgi:hypothetical protein